MAKNIDAVNVAADSFEVLVTQTNNVIDFIVTEAVSANSDANGASVVGNAHVNGIMSATTIATGTLKGGNVQSNTGLIVESNTGFTGDFVYVGNSTVNAQVNSTSVQLSNTTGVFVYDAPPTAQVLDGTESLFFANGTWANLHTIEDKTTTDGTSAALIASFNAQYFYGAEMSITVADNNANARQISKMLMIATGNTVSDTIDMSEYGQVITNSTLGTFSANIGATGFVRLYLTPISTNTEVVVKKSLFTI